jgi:FecR protein
MRKLDLLCGLVLATALAGGAGRATAQNAVASSVKGTVTTSGGSRLTSGAIVSQGQTITTSASSTANVITRDRSNATLGSTTSASVSATSPGSAALNVTQGAFRFVSGSANDRSTITTPLATIGVRGTIIEGYINRNPPREVFVLIEGAMEVCLNIEVTESAVPPNPAGRCVLVTTPGTYVVVTLGAIEGPLAWSGPTLDLDAGVDFVALYVNDVIAGGRDVLPRWREREWLEPGLGRGTKAITVAPSGGGGRD